MTNATAPVVKTIFVGEYVGTVRQTEDESFPFDWEVNETESSLLALPIDFGYATNAEDAVRALKDSLAKIPG